MVQEWLGVNHSSRVRIHPIQADFGTSDPLKSSQCQAPKGIPDPDPPAAGRFGPLLVLLVVAGPGSCEAAFGRLDPFKSQKSSFSEWIPASKTPSPQADTAPFARQLSHLANPPGTLQSKKSNVYLHALFTGGLRIDQPPRDFKP